MDRRRAVAIAAATAATTVGAVAAVAANLGLLGFGGVGASPVGKLDAGQISRTVDASGAESSPATIRYEDVYLPVPTTGTVTGTPAGGSVDDRGADRSGHDEEEHEADHGHEEDDD